MKLRPFALERFFARHEFSARYLMCSSDPETMSLRELLELEPGSRERLENLRLGYTDSRGGDELRHAIGSLYATADADRILVHSGAQEAIFAFMNAAVRAGDHVIVQFPCYQSHYSIAEALGADVTRWHGDLADEGAPDVEELERLVRPATRGIVLTSPNNPTGYPLDRAQMDAVVALARRYGLWLFADEVYRGSEREAERLAPASDLYERGVSLGGLSKAYGLAGLRVGWISTGDRTLIAAMASLKDYSTICGGAPDELLAAVALRHGDTLIERVRQIAAENLDRLDEFFARRSTLFEWKRPRAGTTAFPRYRAGSSEAFCAQLVAEAGVLLLPSTVFDAGDERFRIGYGRANLPKALGALEAFLDSRSPIPAAGGL
ncbi:MAG: aminotransferase class I/II-fold pyridoxal phosphate-dependent enzyme [Candidatus Eremiobacteraeota bacterium]|nr:aminotransferase class I/II-fold pyridoxal phosphate-dependent enzyme [Candidatus Eremiobacteraeota bacterium]MBV8498237.1 aminotransferase class I/II-fold pyridoxal phosphate-dependent enzyme [Candidatus Eremiobacteraeota bacterium]